MPELGDQGVLFAEIAAEWDDAESVIKIAEQVSGKVVLPAVAELRYAGRRLIDAINAALGDAEPDEIKSYLHDALFNCHCAKHDAMDAAFSQIAITLELMVKKLGYENILAAYPGFAGFYSEFEIARSRIVNSRKNRQERLPIYDEIKEIEFPEIVSEFTKIKISEKIMKALAAKSKSKLWISYAVAGISLILALLAWLFPRNTSSF